jgi:hypothetical protein
MRTGCYGDLGSDSLDERWPDARASGLADLQLRFESCILGLKRLVPLDVLAIGAGQLPDFAPQIAEFVFGFCPIGRDILHEPDLSRQTPNLLLLSAHLVLEPFDGPLGSGKLSLGILRLLFRLISPEGMLP